METTKAAFIVGFFTLLSRILGFARECLMAFCLGAGICTDALLIALKLANTFRRVFAEGAFNSSFLPRFSKIFNREGQAAANVVLSDIFTTMTIITSIFCAVIIYFFPSVLKVIVSGFDVLSEKFMLTKALGRICFPYLIFISITSLFSGVLNTVSKFALPAAMYSMLSLFTTTGLLIGYFCELSHAATVFIIAVLVLLSGMTQTYILYLSLRRNGFFPQLKLNFWNQKVKDAIVNMVPGIIGAGVWQLNLLVDTAVASYFPTGSITCLNLADRLNQFPLGTCGIALSTALLPILSKHISRNNYEEAKAEIERGLLLASFPSIFSAIMLIALNAPTVAVAFQRGLFGPEQVEVTAAALSGFVIGLPAYMLTKIYSAIYFAFGDTKSPVKFGICSVVLNTFFIISLVPFFKYFGLALCTSLSAISNAIMLICFCDNRVQLKLSRNFLITIAAQIIAAAATYSILTELAGHFWTLSIAESAEKWIIYPAFVFAAVISYFSITILCMKLFGYRTWKFWKVFLRN